MIHKDFCPKLVEHNLFSQNEFTSYTYADNYSSNYNRSCDNFPRCKDLRNRASEDISAVKLFRENDSKESARLRQSAKKYDVF